MLKEYEVTSFDDGGDKPFQDDFGNFWCTAAFLGITEPVRWVLKEPSTVKVGDKVIGEISTQKSRAGKEYLRFKKASKEDSEAFSGSTGGSSPKAGTSTAPVDWDAKNDAIKAQFAIKAAIAYLAPNPDSTLDMVEQYAKDFFHMVPRVAGSKNLINETFGDVEVIQ